MCGILGICQRGQGLELDRKLSAGLKLMRNRGPNDSGTEKIWLGQFRVDLGHTRLSILDLTSAGHQPMISRCKRYTIVFNGEIYNYIELRRKLSQKGYQFLTDTDTEVLLSAWIEWGESCLKLLRGMFAFAVTDIETQSLTLVRDAFGIKPLFYSVTNDAISFASEVPALIKLLDIEAKPNYNKSYKYLIQGKYDDTGETFFDGIYHVLPAHLLRVNLKQKFEVNTNRWWWPSVSEDTSISFKNASETLRELFVKSVQLHLRSDVPIGVAASGGVDSSAILSAVRMVDPDAEINTFSFIAEGYERSEENWIDHVNHQKSAKPHKIVAGPNDWVRDFDDLIRTQGEPFGSTSIYAEYRVFKLARENGITVMLNGQGADELLAGYHGYPLNRFRSIMSEKGTLSAIKFIQNWRRWPGRKLSPLLFNLGSAMLSPKLADLSRSLIVQNPIPRWLNRDFVIENKLRPDPVTKHIVVDQNALTNRSLMKALREAMTVSGLQALLRHGDRNSMRWSIESRVPFLTIEIAEYLLKLPEQYLLSNEGETKYIFKQAMDSIVPSEILRRRDKIGFEPPETLWLRASATQILRNQLECAQNPLLENVHCIEFLQKALQKDFRIPSIVWRLINFSQWHKIFFGR